MSTILELVEKGSAYGVLALLAESSATLNESLRQYDALQDPQDRVTALKAIIEHEEPEEWRESWGRRPLSWNVSYEQIDEEQADLNEAYAEILDTIVSVLRTEH